MLFTMSLALAAGDHLAAEPDALLAWASMSVLIPDALLFCGRRNIAATPAARLPFATETETNRSFDPASTHLRRMPGRQICRNRFFGLVSFLHANRSPPRYPSAGRLSRESAAGPQAEQKKGAPTCAGAPQRSGHCRVCAQTGVVGAISRDRVPGELTYCRRARCAR